MIIRTKFNVGEEYWMPRARFEYYVDKKLFGGLEYERRTPTLVAYAKQKRIFRLSAEVGEDLGTEIEYWCEDVLEEGEKPLFDGHNACRLCSEKDFRFKTKEEALTFAQNWIKTEKKEYFGEPL